MSYKREDRQPVIMPSERGLSIQPRALMWALMSVNSLIKLWSSFPFREVKWFLHSTDPMPLPFLLWPLFQRQLRQFIGLCKINQNSKRDNRQKIRGNLLFWNERQKVCTQPEAGHKFKCPHVNKGTVVWTRLLFISQPKMLWRASHEMRRHIWTKKGIHNTF